MLPVRSYPKINNFLLKLEEQGRYSFAKDEILSLDYPKEALSVALRRLQKKGVLANPTNGFFIIIPPQYRKMGTPPTTWFLDALMHHKNTSYYVGLLSAAAFYGASHQAIQETQVVVAKALPDLIVGQARLHFFFKRAFSATPTEKRQTPTGYIQVSTRTATLIDVVRYMDKIGGLSLVTTVISELAEEIEEEILKKTLEKMTIEKAALQRLGLILDTIGYDKLGNIVFDFISKAELHNVLLSTTSAIKNGDVNHKWHVIKNEDIEVET